MKKFLVGLLVALVIVYAGLALVGIEPQDRRPGTLIQGIEAPLPQDVSFVDPVPEVTLETQPWYGIPLSVTVVAVSHAGHIYVPSLYDAPMPFPGTKYWNQVVQSNPNVRLRVEGNIYPLQIAPVTDDAEFKAVFAALGNKFPFWREQIELKGTTPRFALLRLSPRETD